VLCLTDLWKEKLLEQEKKYLDESQEKMDQVRVPSTPIKSVRSTQPCVVWVVPTKSAQAYGNTMRSSNRRQNQGSESWSS
jgi:hypothetical protein